MAWGDSDPIQPQGYLSDDDFRRMMDGVYGAGNWRQTGGWRSQAREDQLRAQGAQTVAPGALSAHSLGEAGTPGARDITVAGMTPQQAAAALRSKGYGFADLEPEGAAGAQGAHLHVGMAANQGPAWGASDPVAQATPSTGWGGHDPVAPDHPVRPTGLMEEAGRLGAAAVGGAARGIAGIQRGVAGLLDVLTDQQLAVAGRTGAIIDPGSGTIIMNLSPQQQAQARAAAVARTSVARAATEPQAQALERWAQATEPQNRTLPESIVHAAGELAPALGAAMVNPLAGAGMFGAQGFGETQAEALQAGASPETAERAGMESGALQAAIGSVPVGELAAPVVRGVKGAIPSFLARLGVQTGAAGAQIGAMQAGENVVAEANYDPNRPWWMNVPQAIAGGALGGALLHAGAEGLGAVTGRLRPADRPVGAAQERGQAPADVLATMPAAEAAQAYAQNSAHMAGAVTPDATPVEPLTPPAAFEAARQAEGAPQQDMAPAIADVVEARSAAPATTSLFSAVKALGGVKLKDETGAATRGPDIQAALTDVRRPGLVNNRAGLTPEHMAQALADRGWFGPEVEDPSAAFESAMTREARGDKVFHPESAAPEAIARRAQLDQDMMEAGIGRNDPVEVAAAKLAAMRAERRDADSPEMDALKARADDLGVPYREGVTRDELLADVVEREAIQGDDYDGERADDDERILDEHLTPEEHAWLTAAGRGGEGEPAEAGPAAEAGGEPAPVGSEARGDLEPGAGAAGDTDGTAALPAEAELGAFSEPAEDPDHQHYDQAHADLYRLGVAARDGTAPQADLDAEAERLADRLGRHMDWTDAPLSAAERSALRKRGKPAAKVMLKAAKDYVHAFDTGEAGALYDPDRYHDVLRNAYERGVRFQMRPSRESGVSGERLTRGLEGVELTPEERDQHAQLVDAVSAELGRLAPHAESRPMASLTETAGGQRVSGAAWRSGLKHIVAWALDTADAMGAVRHEAIHALRQAGLFRPEEWNALQSAANTEGWAERYGVAERYGDLSPEAQAEEAIAERFRDWRRDKGSWLPAFVRPLFQRLDLALRRVGAATRRVFGQAATPDDIFAAIEAGDVGRRLPTGVQEGGVRFARPEDRERVSFINRALGEGVDRLGEKAARALDRFLPETAHDLLHNIQLAVSPMAAGSKRAQAAAKDFANGLREVRWEWNRVDRWLETTFKPDQRRRMWEAADEESVLRQQGREPGPNEGLNRLPPDERAVVEELQRRANTAFADAKSLGMTKADALPSYVPRMVVEMAQGEAKRVGRGEPRSASGIGRNLKTTSASLKQRKYLTTEETEAAAKAAFGETAAVVRDIRTLAYATGRLEDAVAGRRLVQRIKQLGDDLGEQTVTSGGATDPHDYFTLDHPSLKTWEPRGYETNPETGKLEAVKDEEGKPIIDSRPLYISKEFEGPLRAVLDEKPGPAQKVANALMNLKGKMMSVIMYSPLMHNAVIWGKAVPAAPLKVLSFEAYRIGARAKNNPATMREAIRAGLDPISRHYGSGQDITAIAAPPQIAPGRSWTAQLLAAAPGLLNKEAGEGVKRAVDKLGDVWHNTFLWDRVGDLQMGLYTLIRDAMMRHGLDASSAQRVAAHFANRYAGSLPMEGMSKAARTIANLALFSRSFTLTNLGAYKDVIAGLPSDIRAQIERDSGVKALHASQSETRKKAAATFVMDAALWGAGLYLAAGAVSFLAHQAFQPPSENEPGREDRFLLRYQPDGTAVYGRLPTGKFFEEAKNWPTKPVTMLEAKMSPYAKLLQEVLSNDKGFGQQLYDKTDDSLGGHARNLGRIVWEAIKSIGPEGEIQGVHDLLTGTGKGDRTTAVLQTVLPMLGITTSMGAPGGPAMADLYRTRDRQQFQLQEALPAIRQQIRDGDIAGARKRLDDLGVAPGLASYYVRTTLNPRARMTGRAVQDFNRAATPQERTRFLADRNRR